MSLTTLARQERTSEWLFSEASFRLSGASFRLAVRYPAGGLGSGASPVVRGADGDWPRWYQDSGDSGWRRDLEKDGPTELPSEYNLHTLLSGRAACTEPL